ncbi:hypothetical protein P3T76_000840 [Phytophthora citrophthora]|uniref:Uncharacterized protein n=1 Tax=Phytophthora citrophthora TaxID=4793 RepID=A0AAD9H1P6_9STRA|nr:hypothetical protein P3T76_000840 [Phytophthora citrophthora]
MAFAFYLIDPPNPSDLFTSPSFMGVLLLLGLLRRLRDNKNGDCQQDYERELRREYRRQCKRQRRWNRRYPQCPGPIPAPPAPVVPVVVQPVTQPLSVRQPVTPGIPASTKDISV